MLTDQDSVRCTASPLIVSPMSLTRRGVGRWPQVSAPVYMLSRPTDYRQAMNAVSAVGPDHRRSRVPAVRLSRSAVADRPGGWHTGPVAYTGPAVPPRSNAMSLSQAFDDAAGALPPQAARLGPQAPGTRRARGLLRHLLLEIRGLARLHLQPGSLPDQGQVLEEEVRGGLPGRVRPDLPDRLRRLCVLPVPHGRVLAGASSTARRRR